MILAAAELSRGIQIATSGMLIVMVALTLISLFIAALPRILEKVAEVFPEGEPHHAASEHPESTRADNEAVVAAIGFVLHSEFQKQVTSDK